MEYKEMSCLAIHDISGVGKCSLTVALPVLSCCGVETSVLPTAVLSTHTGGFTGFTYRDLTDDLLPMAEHWKQVGCRFQSLYSGFLGSAGQIGLVEQIFDWFREENTLVMVDPVMGDGGKLYKTYTPEMASGMARLCGRADIVVPNMTEACHLLGRPYNPGPYTQGEIAEILQG
ncbi:MAG: pyridoxal kinase, partial [Acutalibacter sp.]